MSLEGEPSSWKQVVALLISAATLIIVLLIIFAPVEWWMELVK